MNPSLIAEMVSQVKPGWVNSGLMQQLIKLPDTLSTGSVLPPRDTLRALRYFGPQTTKVVILGQDPYHTLGKACGLSFGIHRDYEGRRDYSSFGNICRELENSGYLVPRQESGDIDPAWATLECWARQGVLLLNTRLSVRPGKPMSHAGLGWETVVPRLLSQVLALAPEAVWLCWGAEARTMAERLGVPEILRISTTHPSKYSASRSDGILTIPFLGSHWPDRVNRILKQRDLGEIDWSGGYAEKTKEA